MTVFHDPENASVRLVGLKILEMRRGPLQEVILYTQEELGKVLVINGELQHVERWAFLYHESVVHIPCAFIENPRRALIIGGGSLFAAAEILKYKSIKELVLIDHDQNVIDMMMNHYGHAGNVVEDRRFKFINGDALKEIRRDIGVFDIIINDCFDLINGAPFCDQDIYSILFDLLSDCGVCSDLIYKHILEGNTTRAALRRIKAFDKWATSLVYVPEYPGVMHLLTMWGKNNNIRQGLSETKNRDQMSWQDTIAPTKFFDSSYISFYFYMPPYLRNIEAI